MNYYNEFDPKAAAWIRELMKAGLIPNGEVDERSITDVRPSDLTGYAQCHFFAGIGGWSAGLNIAKSEIRKNLWTGSCPCQPFSTAGKRNGVNDERHLWPDFFRLIAVCKPEIVFGEQVASSEVVGTQLETAFIVAVQAGEFAKANKLANKLVKTKGFHYQPRWVDRVRADMEAEGYSFEFHVLGAHSVGAPHIRQRLWWVGYAKDGNWKISERKKWENSQFGRPSGFGRLADSESVRSGEGWENTTGSLERDTQRQGAVTERYVSCFGMVNMLKPGLEGPAGDGYDRDEPGRIDSEPAGSVAATSWNGPTVWWPCRDGKFRRVPVEPVFQPIFDGLPGVLGCVWNPITKNIKEWVIDYAKKTERSPDQILREVWETTLSQTLREEFGRHDCVYEKEILLLAMCKLAWGSKYEFYFSTSDFAAICERTLRALWGRKKSSCPPQKWGLDRPPEGEPGNTLYPLPLRGGTQETSQNVQVLSIDSAKERNVSEAFSAFQEIWRSIFDQNSAAGVSKQLHADKNTIIAMGGFPLADGLPGRVGLLRGAGNAIVPQVAAEFIEAAMETIDDLK